MGQPCTSPRVLHSAGAFTGEAFSLTPSFRSSYSRAIRRLVSRGDIAVEKRRELPHSLDAIAAEHASHTPNALIREMRRDVLPVLLDASAEPLRERPGDRARQSIDKTFEGWLVEAAVNPDIIRTPGSSKLMKDMLEGLAEIDKLLWTVEMRRVRAELWAKEEIHFTSAFGRLNSWLCPHRFSRSARPERGLLAMIEFLLDVCGRGKLGPLCGGLNGKLTRTRDLLVKIKDANVGVLEVKEIIGRWNSGLGKSQFRLSGAAMMFLEQEHPDMCQKYAKYSPGESDRSWEPPKRREKARGEWYSIGLWRKPTLSPAHPLWRVIDHHIYRGMKLLRLSSA